MFQTTWFSKWMQVTVGWEWASYMCVKLPPRMTHHCVWCTGCMHECVWLQIPTIVSTKFRARTHTNTAIIWVSYFTHAHVQWVNLCSSASHARCGDKGGRALYSKKMWQTQQGDMIADTVALALQVVANVACFTWYRSDMESVASPGGTHCSISSNSADANNARAIRLFFLLQFITIAFWYIFLAIANSAYNL